MTRDPVGQTSAVGEGSEEVTVDAETRQPDSTRSSRSARAADRRLGGALRAGGLAALLWPFTLLVPARWLIGPVLAAVVTWSLHQVRPGFTGRRARARLDRCLDLVIAMDGLLLVELLFADRPAWYEPWLAALAVAVAVSYAGAAAEEAAARGWRRLSNDLHRARIVLLMASVPTFLLIAWGPLAMHRRISVHGGLPVAGIWFAPDRGWVLAAGAVVILLGAGVAALTAAGHRLRIAISQPPVGKL